MNTDDTLQKIEIQIDYKHIKWCSFSLIAKEMQIKTKWVPFHNYYTDRSLMSDIPHISKDSENRNKYNHFCKQFGSIW